VSAPTNSWIKIKENKFAPELKYHATKALGASARRAPCNINLDTDQQTSRPQSFERITQTVWVDEQ